MNGISKRTLKNIQKIDRKLALIIGIALGEGLIDFTVTSGYRTDKQQADLYAKGRTKDGGIVTYKDGYIRKSKHQYNKAIDFIPYPFDGDWNNLEQFIKVGEELKKIAKKLGIPCRYGGTDFGKFKDFPHFELI